MYMLGLCFSLRNHFPWWKSAAVSTGHSNVKIWEWVGGEKWTWWSVVEPGSQALFTKDHMFIYLECRGDQSLSLDFG